MTSDTAGRPDCFADIDTEAIKSIIEEGASPGCAAAVWSPEGYYEFSAGVYSDRDKRPVSAHTPYDIASITKLFTAASVLRLCDEGKIGLDRRAGDFLPRFSASELTVRDLLTHHAGLASEPLSRMAVDTPDLGVLASRIQIPSKANPRFFYQNATFLFLGMLVEKLRGRAFGDCLLELIKELDLRETRIGSDCGIDAPPTEIRGGLVWVNKTHDESSYLCGGVTGYAGVFSTAADLVKFGRAWLDFRIVSPEMTARTFTNYSGYPGEEQGLGWFNSLQRFPPMPRDVFCHSGYTGSLLAVNPNRKRVYALNCNRTYYGRDNLLYRKLWERMLVSEITGPG